MRSLLQVSQTASARLLLESLADAGVRDVVVSPGSRSTPIVAALSREPRLSVFDVVDERDAAFFALGRARRSGVPALVVTTSGTAGAHAFPAVIEASLAFTPMLVLTADRPLELQGCGALQTVDQRDLFGRHVRASIEIALAESATAALASLRRVAAQAVHATLEPTPGPVHLNVKAKKPLEPAEPTDEASAAVCEDARRIARASIVRIVPPAREVPASLVEALATRIMAEERGIIVAGPQPLGREVLPVLELSALAGYPLLAEATSQLRFAPLEGLEVLRVAAFDAILRSRTFRRAHAPSFVLELGGFPTAGGFEPFVQEEPRPFRAVVAPHGYPDPTSTASLVAQVEPAALARALVAALEARHFARHASAHLEAWTRASRASRAVIEEELARGPGLSEGVVVDEVVKALPSGSTLALGNGLPIRHADMFPVDRAAPLDVVAQRGTSGIDGLISGACALAAESGRPPTALIVGDVSMLHDLGGLAVARHVRAPLAILVIQNEGGRIFEQLPIASSGVSETTLGYFITPHGPELSAAARAFSVPHVAPSSRESLREALDVALRRPGVTLIEARVPPHDARDAYGRIFAAVERALGGER